ncbi:MAG: FadR/GntR family transcriptional regulator [Solirubrobacterales bacterium]
MLEPVSVPSAAEVVVGQLRRAIELGRFLPGDRLPPERELAVQLGVSRVTLRSALGELEAVELLKRVRRGSGGGALVIAAPTAAVTDAGYRALREELEEIFEFRLACEGAAAELAAERRDETKLERIEQAIAALSSELTAAQFRAADNEFHLAIADAAGNRRLRRAVEDARAAMFGPLDSIRFEVVLPSTVEHHRRILDAIAARDRHSSRTSMVDHIREAQREMLVALALVDR